LKRKPLSLFLMKARAKKRVYSQNYASCAGAQIFPTAESEFEKGLALFNA